MSDPVNPPSASASDTTRTDAASKPDNSQFVDDFYAMKDTVAKMSATVNALADFGSSLAALKERVDSLAGDVQTKAASADFQKLSDDLNTLVNGFDARIKAIPAGPKGDPGEPGPAAPFGGDSKTLLDAAKVLRDQIQNDIDGTGQTAEFARAFVPFVNALIAHMPVGE